MSCCVAKKADLWDLDMTMAKTLKLTSADQVARGNCPTVTYYDGDALRTSWSLKERVKEIVKANPWLGGRLVKENGGVVVKYSDDNPHPECFARVKACPELWSGNTYEEKINNNKNTAEALLGMPGVCVAQVGSSDCPLFKVALVTETEACTSKFAIVYFAHHWIADGHTFYTLYKMLDPKTDVVSLKAERVENFEAKEKELVGGYDACGACIAGILRNVFFKPARSQVMFEIDLPSVQARKQKLAEECGVLFVSTNDVISAAYFKATMADVNFMAINLRNKVPEWDDSMAGNYESLIYYMPADVSPGLLRKSLSSPPSFKRAGNPTTELPGFSTMIGGRLSMLSTWASFHGDVKLDRCTQTMHSPIADMAASPFEIGVLWVPGEGRLALMCLLRPETLDRLRSELGEVLKPMV